MCYIGYKPSIVDTVRAMVPQGYLTLWHRKILSRRKRYPDLGPRPVKRFRDQMEWDFREGGWFSRATGDFSTREDLYRTADGRWIIHRWVYRPGRPHYWFEVAPEEARSWLKRVGYEEAVRKFFGEGEGK